MVIEESNGYDTIKSDNYDAFDFGGIEEDDQGDLIFMVKSFINFNY